MRKAVLDCSVLRCLYDVGVLSYLNIFYNKVYIPREVEKEFLKISDLSLQTKRATFILDFYAKNESWFIQCSAYSDEDVDIYLATYSGNEKYLHRGEAEAFTQRNKLSGPDIEILIDETKGRKHARNNMIPIKGTLGILAEMDRKWRLVDYHKVVEFLKAQGQHYSQNAIDLAYQSALE